MNNVASILRAQGVPFTSPTAALRHLKVAEQDSSLDEYNGLLAGLIGRESDLESQAQAKYTYLYFVTNVVRLDGAPNIDIDSLYNESVGQADKFIKKNPWLDKARSGNQAGGAARNIIDNQASAGTTLIGAQDQG
jgi:hypothetical protein